MFPKTIFLATNNVSIERATIEWSGNIFLPNLLKHGKFADII